MAWRHLIARKKLDVALLSGESACMVTQMRGFKVAPKLMEVVLTVDVDKVGKAGDVVKVAKGYARNLLIPQLYALPKLDKYVNLVKKQLEAVKATHQLQEEKVEETEESKTEEQNFKDLNTALLRLENQRVVVKRLTPRQSNNLHAPITPKDIVFEVKKQQNVQIQEINLDMSSLIDALGEYEIPIRLPVGVQIPGGLAKISLKVKVRRP